MDGFANEKDQALLDQDKYTFFVLKRLLGGENTLLLTDHERLIICFSCDPFPVWIWNAPDATEEEMEKAFELCKEHGLMDGKHRFNVKYELAEYFIKRAAEDGINFAIETNMFAYDNPAPIAPNITCDGTLHQCVESDVDELVEFMDLFHREIGIDQQSLVSYRKTAEEDVRNGYLYF